MQHEHQALCKRQITRYKTVVAVPHPYPFPIIVDYSFSDSFSESDASPSRRKETSQSPGSHAFALWPPGRRKGTTHQATTAEQAKALPGAKSISRGNPRPPQEKDERADLSIKSPRLLSAIGDSPPPCRVFSPRLRHYPWPIPPRCPPPPPPSPARWRPGGPSPPLSTQGPGSSAAAGPDRGRSTGCELERGRTNRRTSTGPTPGTSPWISPPGSVSSPATSRSLDRRPNA